MQDTATHFRVAIVGTGFSGLGMAIKLKQTGEDNFIVFEKESGVGGTWHVNHYPGCACDVPSHLYSYSFAPNPNWSRMFSPQEEIRQYLEGCAQRFNIMPHIHLNNAVDHARWDERRRIWQVKDQHGKHYTADFLVMGVGGLSIPSYPNVKGLDQFEGKMFHSQNWDHDYDLKGKRVAVIGTGASAIQFVPPVQRAAAQLDLYQRTPPWVLPKPDRAMKWSEKLLFKRFPAAQTALRNSIYWLLESRFVAFALDPRLMLLAKRQGVSHIRRQIADPVLRKKVTPDYTVGCKRILLSDNYYPALSQPNVNVITDGIREIKANSIVTSNGDERTVDAIILGTGFKASAPIPKQFVFGRDGSDLVETWNNGAEAYKGTTVAGFPNLFILMGPNTGLGHNSMVYMIESQIAYVLAALKYTTDKQINTVEVSPKAQARFNQQVQSKLKGSVWDSGGCTSWYIDPESGKNVTLWPGFTWQFRRQTQRFDAPAYVLNGNEDLRNVQEATA